jgi:hypothetical protein
MIGDAPFVSHGFANTTLAPYLGTAYTGNLPVNGN